MYRVGLRSQTVPLPFHLYVLGSCDVEHATARTWSGEVDPPAGSPCKAVGVVPYTRVPGEGGEWGLESSPLPTDPACLCAQ